jgi:hypothetical protein
MDFARIPVGVAPRPRTSKSLRNHRRRVHRCGLLSVWPDPIVGLGIFAINLDAAREFTPPSAPSVASRFASPDRRRSGSRQNGATCRAVAGSRDRVTRYATG